MDTISASDITPEHLFRSRREFVRNTSALILGSFALAACGSTASQPAAGGATVAPGQTKGTADELGDALTSFDAVTGYNNYYEFTTTKEGVAELAQNFKTTPWTLEVGGMVNKPQKIAIEDLLKRYPQEERIYRLRCVEGWSMVIPWIGFPLRDLLKNVQPQSKARYVAFETLNDPKQMPGQRGGVLDWPYREGLHINEANNQLAILAVGLYGEVLPNQNGAPIRLVTPWKYGFKSIKSIVRISLVEKMPRTTWNMMASDEYGFYANVNPKVDHPRWSQAKERRIGEFNRRPTLMFNGYAEQVASMYAGMDLRRFY